MIVDTENWAAISADLERREIDVPAAIRNGPIMIMDARATLDSFL